MWTSFEGSLSHHRNELWHLVWYPSAKLKQSFVLCLDMRHTVPKFLFACFLEDISNSGSVVYQHAYQAKTVWLRQLCSNNVRSLWPGAVTIYASVKKSIKLQGQILSPFAFTWECLLPSIDNCCCRSPIISLQTQSPYTWFLGLVATEAVWGLFYLLTLLVMNFNY